jgi:hypothetical protein
MNNSIYASSRASSSMILSTATTTTTTAQESSKRVSFKHSLSSSSSTTKDDEPASHVFKKQKVSLQEEQLAPSSRPQEQALYPWVTWKMMISYPPKNRYNGTGVARPPPKQRALYDSVATLMKIKWDPPTTKAVYPWVAEQMQLKFESELLLPLKKKQPAPPDSGLNVPCTIGSPRK